MTEQVSKLTIPVEVPAEFHELMMASAKLIVGLYEPLSDGVDLGDIDDIVGMLPEVWDAIKAAQGAMDGVRQDKFGAALSGMMVADYLADEFARIKEEKEGE